MKLFVVASSRQLTPGILGLTLTPKAPADRLAFRAGQYAAIRFRTAGRPTAVRCFSLVSSPRQPDKIEFGIRVGGAYTQALKTLKPGDTVEVLGAYGTFVMAQPTPAHVVFLAGGIGITPFISMLRDLLANARGPRITLVHSVSTPSDTPYREELAKLAHAFPARLKVVYAVSSGETTGLSGSWPLLVASLRPSSNMRPVLPWQVWPTLCVVRPDL